MMLARYLSVRRERKGGESVQHERLLQLDNRRLLYLILEKQAALEKPFNIQTGIEGRSKFSAER
jgi:hypothetical protein